MPRDRYGDLIEDDDTETVTVHPPYCSGWIDRDADHPIPCLACKPHLARTNTEERTP